MLVDLVATKDGHYVFACSHLENPTVSSVEFYKETGNIVFNYHNYHKDSELIDIEIPEKHRNSLSQSPKVFVLWTKEGNIEEAHEVPFIHVG